MVSVFFVALNYDTFMRVAVAQEDPSDRSGSGKMIRIQQEPSKDLLIEALTSVHRLVQEGKYQAASDYFVLLDDFRPELLQDLLKNRELSEEGIAVLKDLGLFGTAEARLGNERAKALADRAGQNLDTCYGISIVHNSVSADVLASWDGSRFKIFRVNNVGKLEVKQPRVDSRTAAEKLSELAAAVDANPSNANVVAGYAQALYQVGNIPAAWQQLSKAYQLNPQHGGTNRGLQSILMEFRSQGVFNVHVPADTIRSVLGEPSQTRKMGTGYRWVYSYFAVDFREDRIHEVIDLRGATESLFHPTEIVDVVLDGRGWQCGLREKSAGSVRAHFFTPGQSIAEWTESVEIERILDASKIGPMEEIVRVTVDQLVKRIAKLQHKTLDLTGDSAIVAYEYSSPVDNVQRHQLVRYLRGPKDVHRIAYSLKRDEPPSAEQQGVWLKILQAATLKPVGNPSP